MPDAAIIQVRDALAAQITATGGPNVFVDRDDANPIQAGERPAKAVRVTDVTLDERMELGFSAQLHIAEIAIDHYEDVDSTDDLNTKLGNSMAATVALIGADDTLGGRVFELTMVAATANSDDVPDAGEATLTLQVKFQTKLYDWTVLVPLS